MRTMRKENLKIIYQCFSNNINPLFAVACDTVSWGHILKARQSWFSDS